MEQRFLNLWKVPNPTTFMRAFTETFIEIPNISVIKLEPKVNSASFVHTILHFKKENEQNMKSTEKHNSINTVFTINQRVLCCKLRIISQCLITALTETLLITIKCRMFSRCNDFDDYYLTLCET